MPVLIINVIEDQRKTLVELETSPIPGENLQLNKPLIDSNQMLLVMNTMIPSHSVLSSEQRLVLKSSPRRPLSHQVVTSWWRTQNSSTWKSSTSHQRGWKIHLLTSWLGQRVNAFRKSLSTLKMHMRERRIIESLITKEEQHWSWIKVTHIPHLFVSMEPLIHSERLTVQRDNSQTSQDGLTKHLNSVHSELVTYQSMATIKLLVLIAPTSRIQSKIL